MFCLDLTRVFNQCIYEQHAKYLPNIHIYRSETNTHTHTNQREKYSAMRSEPDIKVCAINKLTLLDWNKDIEY